MQKALLASVIVGVVCAVLGCYVVLRSMAFLGDALAHAILPGVAVAYLVGANLLAGRSGGGRVGGSGHQLRHAGRHHQGGYGHRDLLRRGPRAGGGAHQHRQQLRRRPDPRALRQRPGRYHRRPLDEGVLAALVLIAVALLYRQLLVVSFDPILGRTLGLTHTPCARVCS